MIYASLGLSELTFITYTYYVIIFHPGATLVGNFIGMYVYLCLSYRLISVCSFVGEDRVYLPKKFKAIHILMQAQFHEDSLERLTEKA